MTDDLNDLIRIPRADLEAIAAAHESQSAELDMFRRSQKLADERREFLAESWNKQPRGWCEAMASDADAGPLWLRLGYLCWAFIDHAGHAPIGRAEIMRSLGIGNVTNLHRELKKAKDHKVIAECSTSDCLVSPEGGSTTNDPKVPRDRCRFEH